MKPLLDTLIQEANQYTARINSLGGDLNDTSAEIRTICWCVALLCMGVCAVTVHA